MRDRDRRDLRRRRHQIVHERCGLDLSVLVVRHPLVERLRDALGRRAVDLAVDDLWIDRLPAVVCHRIPKDRDATGGRVKIGGEVWSARAFDSAQVLEPGSRVQVAEIEGATALVYE